MERTLYENKADFQQKFAFVIIHLLVNPNKFNHINF